jgi:hypothetical protein
MVTYYVREYGDDGNPGSMTSPFRTVAAAGAVWSSEDTINIGEGTYTETVSTLCNNAKGHIVGQGWDKTTVKITSTSSLFYVNSSSVKELTIGGCTLDQQAAASILDVNACDGEAQICFWRNVVYSRNSTPSIKNSVASPVVTASGCVDVLHNVFTCPGKSYAGTALWSKAPYGIAALNNVFTKLGIVVDDSSYGRGCDLNYNLYYNNDRELRIGDYGDQDIRDADPKFVNIDKGIFRLMISSPCRDAGYDLSLGYGFDDRVPLEGSEVGNVQGYPDIGVEEVLFPTAVVGRRATNLAKFLQAFGNELESGSDYIDTAKTNRDVEEADSQALQQNFGSLYDVYRLI